MSKLICKCGHVISDQGTPSPFEGILFSEVAYEQLLSIAGSILSRLKEAESKGVRTTWIDQELGEGYPDDVSDSELLEDLLSREMQDSSISVSRCKICGRIHLQKRPGSDEYTSFVPDKE